MNRYHTNATNYDPELVGGREKKFELWSFSRVQETPRQTGDKGGRPAA